MISEYLNKQTEKQATNNNLKREDAFLKILSFFMIFVITVAFSTVTFFSTIFNFLIFTPFQTISIILYMSSPFIIVLFVLYFKYYKK